MNLMRYAGANGFENVGSCLFLFFVKGDPGNEDDLIKAPPVRREFASATSVKDAKRIIKEMKADGYRLCWKAFGSMYLESAKSKRKARAA